jgi:NAD(P)-dependent dehydrogenase (short-subunit alcohol dehydrogenase family)
MPKLEGKVAFIAGSAKGIGKAIAECFAGEGACIACADIDAVGAGAVASRIEASGGHALAIDCDVTDSAAVASAVAATVDAFGGLHVVSSNAAAITVLGLWQRWKSRSGAAPWTSTSLGPSFSASTRFRQ